MRQKRRGDYCSRRHGREAFPSSLSLRAEQQANTPIHTHLLCASQMPSRSSIFSVTVEPSLRKGPAQENVKNEAHPTRPPLSIASARALLFCFPLSFSSSSSCWPLETVGASRSAPCCSCDAIFVERERVVVNGAFVRGRSRTSAKRAVSANRAQMQPAGPSGSLPPQRKKEKLCGGLSYPSHGPCSAKDIPYWYLVGSTKVRVYVVPVQDFLFHFPFDEIYLSLIHI